MLKNIALILLLGIAAFSMVKYVSELKARYMLQDSLTQAQGQIAALLQEKQNLLQDLKKEKELNEQLELKITNLKDYLRASKNRISRLFQSNARNQEALEDINTRSSILKAENRALIESRRRFYLENEEFKSKLNSVVELKKAIKELKIKNRKALEGNRGFLIKDGQSTTSDKIKIEVIPAQAKK